MNDTFGEVVTALGHRARSAVPWNRPLATRSSRSGERPDVAERRRSRLSGQEARLEQYLAGRLPQFRCRQRPPRRLPVCLRALRARVSSTVSGNRMTRHHDVVKCWRRPRFDPHMKAVPLSTRGATLANRRWTDRAMRQLQRSHSQRVSTQEHRKLQCRTDNDECQRHSCPSPRGEAIAVVGPDGLAQPGERD